MSLSDWIAAIAALAAILQFIALFWTIGILRRNTRITERAYVSGGGYFPNDPTAGCRDYRFQLTIDNYGKTPAFVTHVEIGYWSLSQGQPPDPPPCTKRHVLSAVLPPGKEGLKMDIKLHRDEIKGDGIFGRFFYEDIFARRWWKHKKRVRSSGFILQITESRETLAIDAPRLHPMELTKLSEPRGPNFDTSRSTKQATVIPGIILGTDDHEVEALTTGPIHWFEHWPTGDLTRRVGALPLKSAAVLPSGCGGIR